MRPIDADALKKDWSMANKCEECPQDVRKCQYEQNFTRMDICEMLDEAPIVGGWISVKDRLPEKSGNVLVCVKLDYAAGARYVQMCHYSAYKKQFGCFDTLENSGFPKFGVVTHWMPLPEPPMEGDA